MNNICTSSRFNLLCLPIHHHLLPFWERGIMIKTNLFADVNVVNFPVTYVMRPHVLHNLLEELLAHLHVRLPRDVSTSCPCSARFLGEWPPRRRRRRRRRRRGGVVECVPSAWVGSCVCVCVCYVCYVIWIEQGRMADGLCVCVCVM